MHVPPPCGRRAHTHPPIGIYPPIVADQKITFESRSRRPLSKSAKTVISVTRLLRLAIL